jgi:hypothetical protein
MTIDYPAVVADALKRDDESLALSLYAQWFQTITSPQQVIQQWPNNHLSQAASLSRKSFYYRLNGHCNGLKRASAALDHFVGLKRYAFSDPMQKPSFLFFPGLPAKPFYAVSELSGLDALVAKITKQLRLIDSFADSSRVSYVEHVGSAPNTLEWQKLKTDWQSQHFIAGGQPKALMQSMPMAFQSVFSHPLIPDCPPFSPEVFISTLEADTYIPPHYGISNVKLTVHIPLKVTDKAWLRAGNDTFNWQVDDTAMVFDDSFLHSAKNAADEDRSVLIFDVWHPALSAEEKSFIRTFMQVHGEWKAECGFLAGLDKGLYKNA